jgi:phosphoglycolate phosphatase
MRTVIFDLDGTLADTAADLIAAANARFAAGGHAPPLDPMADKSTAFRGGRAMLSLGYDRLGLAPGEDEREQDYQRFLLDYAAAIDRETRLYPGAAEAVEALLRAGCRVGICTNKPAALAEDLMQRLGVRDLFGSLVGADTLPVRKPDPAPYRAAVERAGGRVDASLLVGDTETDRKTARAAGVPSILVTFGPDGRAVEALAAEAYMDDYAELGALVDRLLA